MYYIRVAFAVAAGLLCGGLDITGSTGLLIAIAVYLLSYIFLRNVLRGLASQVLDRNKFYLTAIFSYFLIWFAVWTISINLLYPRVL